MSAFRERFGDLFDRPRPIDIRHVDWLPHDRDNPLPPRQRVRLRADGKLPDDPLIHTIALTHVGT